ncbi:putative P-loop containing nucleoside triphosphate hydrolase, leucine-rich repeat domain superfamily [Helianthus annuus]|nr:putative P-loop containing nucleoside triphosphate hydrolase, leucine-rich repeat domain superfamily [Helianthus annuus]
MAELVLAALLPVVFEKLASAALKELARYEGLVAEIEKCKDWLELIQGVLTQASQMKTTNPAVKPWLKNLQHLAYDIDDVFDGWLTEAMQRNFTHDSEDITNKVRKKLIPTCCTNFSSCTNKMHGKLRQINARLELLARQRNDLDLKVKEETRPQNNNTNIGLIRPSAVSPSTTVGRTAEKVEFVQKLLVDNPSDQNFSIVPIVGMAGVGKTNLANFLYNEKKVKNHFAPNMVWVQVSGEFDIIGISQEIFEAVGGEATKAPRNFNKLQEALRDKLSGKRFLLVLDDVWSESHRDWETLVGPFYTCAPGSKIVITTEKDKLFQNLGNKPLIKQLGSLPHVDALSLFAFHALGVTNFDSHLSLKPYADDIVKKCDGLPLALIALGKSLNSKEDEASWKKVLESEIWQLPAEGAALRVSYDDLPTPLKQLFAYCSLFPKGYMFDKDELVALWMAEGFLNESTSNDEIESLGHKYFDELLSRSFFQHAPDNESMFVMHALMNDLATFVAGEFYLRFDNETEKRNRENMMEKYRHISFVREEYVNYKKFETFKKAKSSRTFLALEKSRQHSFLSNKVLANLLPHLPLLRVLSLSNFNISEVPESIGTLRHLRYLNLSQTRITHLPESVCNLYNLQTLIVFGCSRLIELPKSFVKLKNLRHLDIRDTHVFNHIPLEIGEFKSLQTLSNIIIGAEGGFEITKLKDLENICGKISMVGLDKVKDATCASEANLSVKRISELQVEWSDVLDGPRDKELEKEVLNELKPHKDYLQQLKIGSYMGLEFPIWVGDPSFGGLKHVSIRGCKNCTSLPPLGQLPLLKELFVEGFERVTVVGMEFLGTSLSFKSLEILSFVDMPGWGKWSTNNRVVLPYLRQWGKWSTDSGVVFPKLRQLRIRDCPNLVEVLLEALPLLKVLEIVGCDSVVLKKLVQVASSVTKLDICHISRLIDVEWRDVIKNLRAVEELTITDCNAMRYLWESEAVAKRGEEL